MVPEVATEVVDEQERSFYRSMLDCLAWIVRMLGNVLLGLLCATGLLGILWLYVVLNQSECTEGDMWRGICGFMVAPIEMFRACFSSTNDSTTYHDSL